MPGVASATVLAGPFFVVAARAFVAKRWQVPTGQNDDILLVAVVE